MDAIRSNFSTSNGTKIFSQYWRPAHPAKALAIQVHGLGEHCGRYDHVARYFNANDIAFYGFDHHGHGRSEGKRGHIPNYAVLMEEIDQALVEAEQHFPLVPKILYGHSWGGNIALNYLLRNKHDFVAAVVTDPWLHIPKVPAFQEAMARFMNRIFPGLTQNNGLKTEDLSTDPEVGEAYEKDPLVHSKISVRLFVDSDDAAKWALEHAFELPTPLLLMHGKEDKITLPSGSEAFAQSNPKVQLRLWDGLRHEIHNEPVKGDVMEEMVAFIGKHLG